MMIQSFFLRSLPCYSLIVGLLSGIASPALGRDDNFLDPIIVTATRTKEHLKNITSDVVIVPQRELKRAGQSSLIEVLQRQRGVEISSNGGAGSSSSVFLRGTSDKQVMVLIDGIKINTASMGTANWELIPVSQIDHIEIVYAPLSSLYGADAVGGVIQIFTKKGKGAPQLSASAGLGSYGTRKYDANISGASEEDHKLKYSLGVSHENAAGYPSLSPFNFNYSPAKVGYKRDSGSASFSFNLGAGQILGLNFLHNRLNTDYNDYSGRPGAHSVTVLQNTSIYSKNQFTSVWDSFVQLSQSKSDLGDFSSFGASQTRSIESSLQWQNNFKISNDLLQILLERRDEKLDASNYPKNYSRNNQAVAALYQIKHGAQNLNLSLRHDANSEYGSHTTGSIGYIFDFSKNIRSNVSYGTSFRAPTFTDLYYPGAESPNLKAEEGKNTQISLRYDDGRNSLSATLFENRIRNMLNWVAPCPLPGKPYGCIFNTSEATIRGLSLGGSTHLGQVRLSASLDLQNPHNDALGGFLVRRSRQHGALGLDYTNEKFSLGGNWTISGKRYDDPKNTKVMGGYALLDLYASYELGEKWQVFGRWNNVLNKDYELAYQYETPGSNVFFGVRLSLQ